MGTYAISDIHGHVDELYEMLSLIGFSDDDELYVLGDMLDKGPKSAEALLWATSAGNNVHFLLGNHEDMASYVLARDPETLHCMGYDDVWSFNGGWQTLEDLEANTDGDWRRDVLVPWLASLRPYTFVDVAGKIFALVHAGFNPGRYTDPELKADHVPMSDGNCDTEALHVDYDVGRGIGRQYSQDLMWIREGWIFSDKPSPVETVYGHTYVKSQSNIYMAAKGITGCYGGSGVMSHILNRHGIDCGCAYAKEGSGDEFSLACLRLDDMEEFYVPAGREKKIF